MFRTLFRCLTGIALFGLAAFAAAHTFFFGLTELSVNTKTNKIEIIHQFTAHDVENLIAEQKQINFSPEHSKYEKYIQEYFESHFLLSKDNSTIKLLWVGIESSKGKLFIYQESENKTFLLELVVKNDLLVDTYPNQVNTVNYQDAVIKGSLTFSQSQKLLKIESNN